MIKPLLKDEAFLADIAATSRDPDELRLWWLGQSGFLVQWRGRHLLFDPYLSDSLTVKYAATDKPHVRMTERVVAPGKLAFVDVVTSSHNHTDHLDAETLRPLLGSNPSMDFVIPEANRDFVTQRLALPNIQPRGLSQGESLTAAGFKITAVPAAHETLEKDELGRCRFLGYVVECGPWTLYHSGDTVRFEGMAEILRPWRIDVALLPINGRNPDRRVAGNLDGREAAELARDMSARLVIPCHYEMFEFNTASPASFEERCWELGQEYRTLRNGESWSGRGLAPRKA